MSPSRSLRALLAAALLLAGGTVLHFAEVQESYAFSFDREGSEQNEFTAHVPVSWGCAVWSNSTQKSGLKITGIRNRFDGCLHANGEIEITKAPNTFNRTLRYVTSLSVAPGQTLARGSVRVAAEGFPFCFPVSPYAPGGALAEAAAAEGRYHSYKGPTTLTEATLTDGIHYVEGDLTLRAPGKTARVTLIATGSITFDAEGMALTAYTEGLLAATREAKNNLLEVRSPGSTYVGALYAPAGTVRLSGSTNTFVGPLMGNVFLLTGNDNVFEARTPIAIREGALP